MLSFVTSIKIDLKQLYHQLNVANINEVNAAVAFCRTFLINRRIILSILHLLTSQLVFIEYYLVRIIGREFSLAAFLSYGK